MVCMNRRLKIPYGIKDFKRIREEGYYYVDKTAYVRRMEERDSFVFFARPRRMGKSLFVETLRRYYDVNEKGNFRKLFGGLDIGENPTENANRYQVLALDFSLVAASSERTLEQAFDAYMDVCLDRFFVRYPNCYPPEDRPAFAALTPEAKFAYLSQTANERGAQIYLVIDEYDNFTNTMLRSEANRDYRAVTHGAGFYRGWFKKFKEACSRIFMTGVSPVTMDDLTSGFNIAANLTQLPAFNAMAGFSEAEVVKMYSDFKGVGEFTDGDPAEIVKSIKPWYDGYCFSTAKIGKECVFNSDMALYYLKSLVDDGRPPENMVDANVRTDYEKLKIIAEIQRQHRYCAGTGSCAVQDSDVQDGAMASAPASAAAGQATAPAAAQALASGFRTASGAAVADAFHVPPLAPAAADEPAIAPSLPSEFRTTSDAAENAALDSVDVLPVTERLAATGEISFDLVESFPADRISDLANFHSLFHYYGIVSMQGRRRGSTVFRIPNVCVRRQLFDYLRDTYHRTRAPDWIEWSHLASAFAYDGDWKPFLRRLARDYAETTPVRGGLQGEIRVQGYMQAEFGHLKFYLLAPEMELSRGFCDFCLFPERVHYGDASHSYLIELKYAKAEASDEDMAGLVAEAKAQLAKYRADRSVPSLARGTTLHQIVYVFRGTVLHTLEQFSCEQMA